jgi:hypothetical protein
MSLQCVSKTFCHLFCLAHSRVVPLNRAPTHKANSSSQLCNTGQISLPKLFRLFHLNGGKSLGVPGTNQRHRQFSTRTVTFDTHSSVAFRITVPSAIVRSIATGTWGVSLAKLFKFLSVASFLPLHCAVICTRFAPSVRSELRLRRNKPLRLRLIPTR